VERVCKNKTNRQEQQARVVEHHQEDEEQLFKASCYLACSSNETWLIDSGCINHTTNNVSFFKELDESFFSKVVIGNGQHVEVKDKGVVAVETLSGIKYISDVLFVPEINQSLLSVGQMMEKNYSLHFKDMKCTIFYPSGSKLMIVGMSGKSFPVEWKKTSLHVFPSRVDANLSAQKRGTLDGNYARCNIAMLETARYTEAANFEGCKVTMQEEKKIIEKNVDCNVVDASVYDLCVFQDESGDLLDYAESGDVKTASDCVFSFGRVVFD